MTSGALPVPEYREPILEILREMRGRGERPDILARLEKKLGHQLGAADYEPRLTEQSTPTWQHHADSAREKMVKDGLLREDSEWGVWELTQEGWDYKDGLVVYID